MLAEVSHKLSRCMSDIMRESHEIEMAATDLYRELLELVRDRSVLLEFIAQVTAGSPYPDAMLPPR